MNDNPIKVDDLINNTCTQRRYNENNDMVKEILATGATLSYLHDQIGRPLKITLPDQTAIAYAYSATNLNSISRLDANNHLLYSHTYNSYDLSGRVQSMQLSEQAGSLAFEYDKLGRIKTISTANWKETISTYDAVGNILDTTIQGNQAKYSYDSLYQLTSEGGNVSHNYSYDSQYNRRNKDGISYTLNQLNQILDDGTYRYEYDLNGNLIQKSAPGIVFKYVYDAWDRLISYEEPDLTTAYFYDETHRRLSKTTNTSQTTYLYQGQNEIGAINATGNITELRILGTGLGAEIGAAIAMEIDGITYIPIHDHQGNVAALLDTAGNLLEEYHYTAYGEELFENPITPWRFSSKRVDKETGYIYFGRRYYDASIGRMLTPDPIGREGGPNLYAYVLNNPLTHFDRYGLKASGGFVDSLFNIFGIMREACMGTVDMLGTFLKEQLPIPILRDAISSFSHFLHNGTLNGYEMEYNGHHSSCERTHGLERTPNKERISFVNGMENTKEEAEYTGREFSRTFGGCDVDRCYNAKHGRLTNTGITICQKLGIPTNSVKACVKMVRNLLDDLDADGRIRLYGHSQGGQIIDGIRPYFNANELSRIDVVTMGSAKIIENSGFGSVRNYVSTSDPIPFLADPLGMIRSCFSSNYQVDFLHSDECFGTGHGIESNAYQRLIQSEGAAYIKRHAIGGY